MVDSCRGDECTVRLVDRDCLLKKEVMVWPQNTSPTKHLSIPKGNVVTQYRKLTDNHLDRVIEAVASRAPDVVPRMSCPRCHAPRRAQLHGGGVPAWKAWPESRNTDGIYLKNIIQNSRGLFLHCQGHERMERLRLRPV